MSAYGIMRVQKCKGTGVGAAQYHNDREPGWHSNPDIDASRSHLNFSLIQPGNYEDEVERRIKDGGVTRKVRHDAVKLIDGIITASPEFFVGRSQEEMRAYFQDCCDFICDKFGKNNIIAFTIHMDERTPHAHFEAVPILDGKLAWKNFFPNKGSFSKLQDEFYEKVTKGWGLERGEKGTGRMHKDVAEFKRETYKETLALVAENETTKQKIEALTKTAGKKEEQVEFLSGEVATLRDRREEIAVECDALSTNKESLQRDIGGIEGQIQDYEEGIRQYEEALPAWRARSKEYEAALNDLSETVSGQKSSLSELDRGIEELEDAIPKWREAITGITGRIQQLRSAIGAARDRLTELPELIAAAWNKLPLKKQLELEVGRKHVEKIATSKKSTRHNPPKKKRGHGGEAI